MISKEKILLLAGIIIVFSMSFVSVFGDKGLADYNMLKKAKESLMDRNAALVQENLALYRSIERLKNDYAFIENVARQELGMVGENELIIRINDPSALSDELPGIEE